MARRQIGQEGLRLSEGLARHGSSLDALAALLNWGEIDDVLHRKRRCKTDPPAD